MEPKVSVVVPIYRVEKYLAQCVDSLLAQTLGDLEIILVDDGSPDHCGAIADAYADKDPRVRVIHQENAGLGPARNTGISAATGAYIGFVDSDDWVRPEMYQRLYEAAQRSNADIVVSGHRDMAGDKVLVVKAHPLAGQTLNNAEEIQQVRNCLFGHAPQDKEVEAFPMTVWASIYRRSMIQNHNLRFRNILSEDTIFNLGAYPRAAVITFTGGTDYCYRKENQTSITQSFSEGKQLRFQEFLTELTRIAEQEGDEKCILRTKRMAIDYCRLYVGAVASSSLSFAEQKRALRQFAQKDEIKRCWEGYPVRTLPIKQKIFHGMILGRRYGVALVLNKMRRYDWKRGK